MLVENSRFGKKVQCSALVRRASAGNDGSWVCHYSAISRPVFQVSGANL